MKPMLEHLEDYIKIIKARNRSKDYTQRMKARISSLLKACQFIYFRDVTQSSVELYLAKMKKDGYGTTTRGHYLDAFKTFLNWAKEDSRIVINPMDNLRKESRESELKGILTPDQFILLIRTTIEKDFVIQTTSGIDRGVLYFLAGATGLRRKELLLLTWDALYIHEDHPYILARADITKNAKEAKQPIPLSLANLLKTLRTQRKLKTAERIFDGFAMSINTAWLIREDMKTAKIPLYDKDRNEICFHSLRNSYISFLANGGAPAKIVQKLARHSDPRLTFNTYARAFEESEQEAIALLPNIGQLCIEKSSAIYSAIPSTQTRTLANNDEQENLKERPKTAILSRNGIPPRGLEPLLPG